MTLTHSRKMDKSLMGKVMWLVHRGVMKKIARVTKEVKMDVMLNENLFGFPYYYIINFCNKLRN